MHNQALRILIALLAPGAYLQAQPLRVPNASFEEGDGRTPISWKASGESCRWEEGEAADGRRFVSATGTGTDMSYWRSAPIAFVSGRTYRVSFRGRDLGSSGGTAVTGPLFCNVDLGRMAEEWTEYSSVFVTPDELPEEDRWLRFGQWHVSGKVGFDRIALREVSPVYGGTTDMKLGAGESIDGTTYTFQAPFVGEGRNHSRPLAATTCGFNSSRWVFGANGSVVYRHRVGNRTQLGGQLEIVVNYHVGGKLTVEASNDGTSWVELGTRNTVGSLAVPLLDELFPAKNIFVRLKAEAERKVGAAESDPGSFQVNGYRYQATVDGAADQVLGSTRYLEINAADPGLDAIVQSIGDAIPGKQNAVTVTLRNRGATPVTVRPTVRVTGPGHAVDFTGDELQVPKGVPTTITCAYDLPGAGDWQLEFSLADASGKSRFQARAELGVPTFFDVSYGELLPDTSAEVGLWWANSGWKIPPARSLPKPRGAAIRIDAARNEAEAAQLVIRPRRELAGLTLEATPLRGPGGAILPSDRIDILRVYYHNITRKTDRTGVLGEWPDALPPVKGPLTCPKDRNQPFWVRVRVPSGIPAGIYRGAIRLAASSFRAEVPLRVRVYGFDLPARMTCSTAFGFSPGNVWRYQGISDPEQRRAVLEKYWENFRAHHISPYNPAPLDPFRVEWPQSDNWQGGMRDREHKFSGKGSLRLTDTSEKANVSAHCAQSIAIPKNGLRLRCRYRTEKPGHSFIVTFNHFDRNGQWMSYRNNDMAVTGDGSWQLFDRTISRFPPGAVSVRLTLWATRYQESGTYTGTVWYDDLSVSDPASGKELLASGEFEPVPPAGLVPRIQWDDWDRAMQRGIDEYGFNSFRLPIQGLGGGTFHARTEPSLHGYPEGTPEYESGLRAYLGAVEAHLKEKGWLDEAFVYWFDEPDRKDYEFVLNGFGKLRTYAPGLRRMLTEQVEDDLLGGPNIWCPVSSRYNHGRAEERRRQGETFWWYVCTGPKAPYCTLFIDHPATELRVWLWQTWKRKIDGILVWATNYWTSSAAYPEPDAPQNPYLDPMGWVSGYSTPAGTKRPWGNGDGRFIYPPLAAADASPSKPVLEGPVDSIRWEMLRDGIEDYEYHAILKRLLRAGKAKRFPQAKQRHFEDLLEVPESITKTRTEFTRSPAPIAARRESLAEAIEILSDNR